MDNLKIKSENSITKVYLNDKEIHGIRGIKFKHNANIFPTLKMELCIDDYDIELENPCVKKEPFIRKMAHKIKTKFV